MVNATERRTVLLTPCRWCGASTNEECTVTGSRSTPITTLEGGFHDTRFRDALGRPASVVGSCVLTTDDTEDDLVTVGGERPW